MKWITSYFFFIQKQNINNMKNFYNVGISSQVKLKKYIYKNYVIIKYNKKCMNLPTSTHGLN